MMQSQTGNPIQCDVLVAGSGPAGATAALVLARQGVDVLMVEKAPFPRFQIGESLLPFNMELLQQLGLADRLKSCPHILKRGAEFGMGGQLDTTLFRFDQSLSGKGTGAFNIARADLDAMLQQAAVEAGARLMTPVAIKHIHTLEDENVRVTLDDGRQIHAKYMVDATGQATMVGRHLKLRQMATDKHLRKTAYFQHFTNVKRLPGENEGMPTIAMCAEGWFWIIPLNETVTSVGLVLEPQVAQQVKVPANQMLQWGIRRCPLVHDRMKAAVGPSDNQVRGDFSYRCAPFAGPGFFLAGDAAMFLDPVFSTGVCLGMCQGMDAGNHLAAMLAGKTSPARARQAYRAAIVRSTGWFSKLIGLYYDQSFRELFLEGSGPLQMHRAVIAILAGHVFPAPSWAVRWRFTLFEAVRWLQQYLPLAPRKPRYALLGSQADLLAHE